MGRVFEWIKRHGGIDKMYSNSLTKSKLIYDVIDGSEGFFVSSVDVEFRSRITVPFRIGLNDEHLEKAFLVGAEELKMVQLKGHHLVGGIRVSLYNSISIEDTTKLANYMQAFYLQHRK